MPRRFIHLGLGWIGDKGGGLERYQHGICHAHSKLGCEVSAWVQSRGEIESGLPYRAVAFASPLESRASKLKKLRAIALDRFRTKDFIFVSHHASVSASLTDLSRDVPHIVHFQGPWADEAAMEGAPMWKTFLQRRQERKAYHAADRIITLSDAFRQIVVDQYGVSPDVVRVVPGAIDTDAADPKITRIEARQRLGWPLDRPIVLSMRRLVRRVGVDVLVEAIGQLLSDKSKRFSDALFLIGGSGALKDDLTRRIKELELENNVRLLGFVPDELLSTAYRAADFSVVPTQSLEGFGLVTIESMSAGTPVVVTPVGSLPEIIMPFDSNLILRGVSAGAIADGLRGFLAGNVKMPSENACREYVKNNYDWKIIAPKVLEVYSGSQIDSPVHQPRIEGTSSATNSFAANEKGEHSSSHFLHLGLGWIGEKGGGLERYQHGVCSAHAMAGVDVKAWVRSDMFLGNVKYDALAFASPSDSRFLARGKLRALANEYFLDHEFTFVSHHASVCISIVDLIKKHPHVVHFHGPWAEESQIEGKWWWRTRIQRQKELIVYRSASRIITLSDAFKQIVTEQYGVSPDIVHVVPGAIDTDAADPKISRVEARERLGWPLDRPIVLTMRRLVRRVGVDVLLEAIGKLQKDAPKRFSDALFLIGGSGPLKEELTRRIAEVGLENHVRLLGFVPDEQLSTAYRAADFSIVPTQSLEGFGLVTIESMAAGTPVVVTPVGSLPEIMLPLDPNLVLSGAGAEAIADGLRAYLGGELALPDELRCREYVKGKYDWGIVAPKVLDVYRGP